MWESIEFLGRGLSDSGVNQGDRVVILLPNSKEFIYAFMAVLKIGAVAVPLKTIFTNREYKEFFDETEPKFIVTTSYIFLKVLAYESSFLEKYQFIISDEDPLLKLKYRNIVFLGDLIQTGKSKHQEKGLIVENDMASINYTYTGYGYPIGAILTHDNYLSSVDMISSQDYVRGDKHISALPMAHIFGLICHVLVPLLKGLTTVIVKGHAAWEFLKAIEEQKVDVIYGVPTFFTYLLKSFDKSKFDLSSVQCAISGGSYLTADLQRELELKLGIKFFQGYGLTEGLVSSNGYTKEKIGTLGAPLKGLEVRIVIDNSREGNAGQPKGEIVVKGPNVTSGYYKKNEETKEAIKAGWFYTGDYGEIDDEGFIHFLGYKKNIAKVGGNIVDLTEIEKVLMSHPHVYHTKVYSEHDTFWGEIVIAEVHTGKKTDEDEILDFCGERLAVYKIPKRIKIVTEERENILIVDGETESLESCSSMLKETDYQITTADTGSKAIEEIKSGFYDLLICHPQLPDKEGQELLDKVATINAALPIILVGSGSLLASLNLKDKNIQGTIIKPCSKDDFINKIEGVLKKGKDVPTK